jgi:hypothetical protein
MQRWKLWLFLLSEYLEGAVSAWRYNILKILIPVKLSAIFYAKIKCYMVQLICSGNEVIEHGINILY